MHLQPQRAACSIGTATIEAEVITNVVPEVPYYNFTIEDPVLIIK